MASIFISYRFKISYYGCNKTNCIPKIQFVINGEHVNCAPGHSNDLINSVPITTKDKTLLCFIDNIGNQVFCGKHFFLLFPAVFFDTETVDAVRTFRSLF